MSVITRFQLANFLCEGYGQGHIAKEWTPLYQEATFPLLHGRSAAIQVQNGGGKTSIVDAMLYLMSRNGDLGNRVKGRMAPNTSTWTHVRIEFGHHVDDPAQPSMFYTSPEEFPGQTYVAGFCGYRNGDIEFYLYSGTFEDAPLHRREGNALHLIANDEFKRKVMRIEGARWDVWGTHKMWREEMDAHIKTEVVQQNVQFQLGGAGDASAKIYNIKPEGDETFSEAFFRRIVAPELLRDAMGEFADEDERNIETTLMRSLRATTAAHLNVQRKEADLKDTQVALDQFRPVLESATEAQQAQALFDASLTSVASAAGLVHALMTRERFPGLLNPAVPEGKLGALLAHFVMDQDDGALILDSGLKLLTGVETGVLNQTAERNSIAVREANSQAIEMACDFGFTHSGVKGGGHRRRVYTLDGALRLLPKLTGVAGATLDGAEDLLKRAYGHFTGVSDTNPYRLRLATVNRALATAVTSEKTLLADKVAHEATVGRLATAKRDAKENETAYSDFRKRIDLFPPEFINAPAKAQVFARDTLRVAKERKDEHLAKVYRLKESYKTWCDLRERYFNRNLVEILGELVAERDATVRADDAAKLALHQADAEREAVRAKLAPAERREQTLAKATERFAALLLQVAHYAEVFGTADPATLDVIGDQKRAATLANTTSVAAHALRGQVQRLLEFRAKFSTNDPAAWLTAIEEERGTLAGDRKDAEASIVESRRSLVELDKYGIADQKLYADAIAVLDQHGVRYQRLKEVVERAIRSDQKRERLLTLFSGLLSAPVVENVAVADSALRRLEAAHCTVPVFLKEKLIAFLHDGTVDVGGAGDVAFTYLVGRRTKQVAILLDPSLLEREKHDLTAAIATAEAAIARIDARIAAIKHGHPDMRLAEDARRAVDAEAEAKLPEAEVAETVAAKALEKAERLARQTKLIDDAKEFAAKGGQLGADEAGREWAEVRQEVAAIQQAIADAATKVQTLKDAAEAANQKRLALAETVVPEIKALEGAIAFEQADLAFMQESERVTSELETAVDKGEERTRFNFERAQSFIDSGSLTDIQLAEQLAAAEGALAANASALAQTQQAMGQLRGEAATLTICAVKLHEVAVKLRGQYEAVAPLVEAYANDVQFTGGYRAHPIYRATEDLRVLLIRPDDSESTRSKLSGLRDEIEGLDLRTQTTALKQLQKERDGASKLFDAAKRRFCDAARSNTIPGLRPLEIEKIEEATNLAELGVVLTIQQGIQARLQEEQATCDALKATVQEQRTASIDNLTAFARRGQRNLSMLNEVMRRTPDGRFFIDVKVPSDEHVRKIVEKLITDIENRETFARGRGGKPLTNYALRDAERTDADIIRKSIYRDLFQEPQVSFSHASIWNGEKSELNDKVSQGQLTALHLMWMIKQAEYTLHRAVQEGGGSAKQRKAAATRAQRIMLFDGLFSNLSDEAIIDEAMQGLRFTSGQFQLIGFVHHPRYVNNTEIFPVHLVAKRLRTPGGKGGGFVQVAPWRADGSVGMFASYFHPTQAPTPAPAGAAGE